MSFILDTHVFFWWITDDGRLENKHRQAIEARDATVFVSAVTGWEIGIKVKLGMTPVSSSRVGAAGERHRCAFSLSLSPSGHGTIARLGDEDGGGRHRASIGSRGAVVQCVGWLVDRPSKRRPGAWNAAKSSLRAPAWLVVGLSKRRAADGDDRAGRSLRPTRSGQRPPGASLDALLLLTKKRMANSEWRIGLATLYVRELFAIRRSSQCAPIPARGLASQDSRTSRVHGALMLAGGLREPVAPRAWPWPPRRAPTPDRAHARRSSRGIPRRSDPHPAGS